MYRDEESVFCVLTACFELLFEVKRYSFDVVDYLIGVFENVSVYTLERIFLEFSAVFDHNVKGIVDDTAFHTVDTFYVSAYVKHFENVFCVL